MILIFLCEGICRYSYRSISFWVRTLLFPSALLSARSLPFQRHTFWTPLTENMLRNQWWIIMNYLYMGVSMGLYSIHCIPRKWSIRLSLLLGPSSTMIPALNLPQVFITEEDRPKLKCHWLGDRIIDHCLQINWKADLKFWWGPKHPKPIAAGRSEIWHTQHPKHIMTLPWCLGRYRLQLGVHWKAKCLVHSLIPHCFRWVKRIWIYTQMVSHIWASYPPLLPMFSAHVSSVPFAYESLRIASWAMLRFGDVTQTDGDIPRRRLWPNMRSSK
jgi:hypothetical protein